MSSEESLNCIQIQGPEYVIRSSGNDLSRFALSAVEGQVGYARPVPRLYHL